MFGEDGISSGINGVRAVEEGLVAIVVAVGGGVGSRCSIGGRDGCGNPDGGSEPGNEVYNSAERADPCLMQQKKRECVVPNGVDMVIWRSSRDSAIHSM